MLDHESLIVAAAAKATSDVTDEAMNRVYEMLRSLDDDQLRRMWKAACPHTQLGLLARAQIAYVFEKRERGLWLPTEGAKS